MECGKVGEEDDGSRMVACELAAAEALAGMARCYTAGGGASELRTQHAMESVVNYQDSPLLGRFQL